MVSGATIRHGLLWTLVSRGGSQVLQIAFSVVLARLLLPAEFGLIALLLTFSGFAQLLADSGLTTALIHKETLTEADLSTSFWIQLGISLALGAIFILGAAPLAAFLEQPLLAPLTAGMSIVFAVQAIGQIHSTLIRRALRFQLLSLISLASVVVSGIGAVAMAALGYGVWSLFWQLLLQIAVTSVFSMIFCRWRPRLLFNLAAARTLGHFGGYLLGFSALNYWLRNADNLVIGRVLGPGSLGIYARAYNLMLLPINNIGGPFGQVMFPALARIQSDPPRFRRVYLRAVRMISFVAFPLMTGLALLSRQAILILYGPRWEEVVPLFTILALVGIVQAIGFPVGWVFTALGRTRAQFHISVILTLPFCFAMWIGVQGGLIGVTYAYAGWTFLALIVNMRALGKISGIHLIDVARELIKISVATGVMAITVSGLNFWLIDRQPLIVSAAAGAVLGIVVYMLCSWMLREAALYECTELLAARLRRRASVAPAAA